MLEWYHMLDFYQKRKLKNVLHSHITLVVLLLLLIPLVISVHERYQVERDMAARRAEIEDELDALRARKTTLEERVNYLQDDRGIESEIRRHFDVAKEGEQVVIIIDEEENVPATTTTTRLPLPAPWWMFWR